MVLETERLYLREFSPDDGPLFFELNTDPEVLRYTGDRPFESVEESIEFLKNYPIDNYEKYGCGRWAVILKQTGDWLGWCGLKYSPKYEEVDLGYRFFRKYWGKGFATESARACMGYGFENLKFNRIIGRAMKDNVASIIVLKKIGMQFEKEFLMDGKYPAVQYYANSLFKK